ncbi:hypothetical protein EV426DRAFT_351341 [Tirmania nivea]|nr:hypothetical protein EV426DRAFT_351341 [Tirmania nivea]
MESDAFAYLKLFRLRIRRMHSVPRISRRLFIIICCIQVFLLLILSSLRLAPNVTPFDVHEYFPNIPFLRGGKTTISTAQQADSKITLLIPIHKPNLQFCRCLRTHLINGFEPILVNLGIDNGGNRANKYFKIQGVFNYIKRNPDKLRPYDVIAVIDGFDAYSQQGPDTLLDRFKESGQKIYTGVDKNCFPNDPSGPVCNNIPESEYSPDAFGPDTDKDKLWADRRHTRPRWVNSGTIIGYYDALEKLYDSMVNYKAPDDDHGSDQRLFAVHYYWGNFSVALDFKSRLAVSVAFSEWELDFLKNSSTIKELGVKPWTGKVSNTGQDVTIDRRPIVRNRLMGTAPVFVHFPGVARGLMTGWEQTLWWTSGHDNATWILTDYVLDKVVTVAEDQRRYTFREICGSYVRPWGKLAEPSMDAASGHN